MNIIRLCGVAIISVVAAVLVKRVKADFGAFVSIIAAVVIFGAAVSAIAPLTSYVSEIAETSG